MIDKIIGYIKRNRVSTTEVADCLDKTGLFRGANALNKGHFRVGKIFYVGAFNKSNWNIHKEIINVNEGDVVLINNISCYDKALFGELVSKYLFLYKQITAVVTNGFLRDGHKLIKENYPIWCAGLTPIGCFNNEVEIDKEKDDIEKQYYKGALAVCDDSGVVVVEEKYINEDFLKKLEWIEKQEDVWFDCIDSKKWNTFDTVCLKKYLEEK